MFSHEVVLRGSVVLFWNPDQTFSPALFCVQDLRPAEGRENIACPERVMLGKKNAKGTRIGMPVL